MRFWFDTEFLEDGKTIELISIGVVCEDGTQYYAEVAEYDRSKSTEWLVQNVHPHLKGGAYLKPRAEIATDLRRFFGYKPEIWAYFGAYDWVALCQLYGRMLDMPFDLKWPHFVLDVKQYCVSLGNPKLPPKPSAEHYALADALWTREAWQFLAHYEAFQK